MSQASLQRVARAVLQTGVAALEEDGRLSRRDIADHWWQALVWAERAPAAMLAEIRQLASRTADEARAAAFSVAEESLCPLSTPHVELLHRYLAHLPAFVKRQLQVAGQPLPAPAGPRDLVPFLPRQAPRFLPGKQLAGVGDLEIEAFVAGGGFGEVYRVRPFHRPSQPPVILKIAPVPDGARLLRHELRILDELLARDCTDGILHVDDTFLSSGEMPALKFPWLNGYTLEEILPWRHRTQRIPDPYWVARFLARCSQILRGVHRTLFVHRDIKPANLMIGTRPGGRRNDLFLIDFGIAGPAGSLSLDEWDQSPRTRRLIDRVLAYGHSPVYASPEQVQGELVVPADDVYSAGVVAVQALTGNFHQRVEEYDWIGQLEARATPAWLIEILQCCVDEKRQNRPADGGEMFEYLVERADALLC